MQIKITSLLILWCLICTGIIVPVCAQTNRFDQITQACGLTSEDITKISSGQIIFKQATKTADEQLFLSGFFLLQTTCDEFEKVIKEGNIINTSKSALAITEMYPVLGQTNIQPVIEKCMTEEAAIIYKNAAPGLTLNLSKDEISQFTSLTLETDNAKAGITPRVTQDLFTRAESYRLSGLFGVAPYARKSGETSVANEIRAAALCLPDLFPGIINIKDAVDAYPMNQPKGAEQFFQLTCQDIEDRPDFILSHFTFFKPQPDSFLAISRQYYVSHSYNSLLIVIGGVQTEKGFFVFYYNSTFTDLITGMLNNVKKTVGLAKMKGEIQKQMATFKSRFDQKAP